MSEFEITKTFEDFPLGETFESDGRTVTEADIRLFIGATGATHPNHVDREFATHHPVLDLDDVVAHGVLTLSVADGFVSETLGAGETLLATNYGYDRVRFLNPVYPGDTVTATIEVVDRAERDDDWGRLTLDVTVTKQTGDAVLVAENVQLVATADFAV